MFISPAYAQFGGGSAGGSEMFMQLLPFVLIFVIMYMLILRPQQKRQKQHQEMLKNIRRGDTIVTSGGLRVRQSRAMIADVRAKGEPVKDESAAKSAS